MHLDTDVIIDLLRGHPSAIAWIASQAATPIAISGLVVMEVVQGCRNTAEQKQTNQFLSQFHVRWPTEADCQRALQEFTNFRLSHGLGILDALIGATAVGCGEPLATFNMKHYSVIPGLVLVQPY